MSRSRSGFRRMCQKHPLLFQLWPRWVMPEITARTTTAFSGCAGNNRDRDSGPPRKVDITKTGFRGQTLCMPWGRGRGQTLCMPWGRGRGQTPCPGGGVGARPYGDGVGAPQRKIDITRWLGDVNPAGLRERGKVTNFPPGPEPPSGGGVQVQVLKGGVQALKYI